jgi:hypothetical protein
MISQKFLAYRRARMKKQTDERKRKETRSLNKSIETGMIPAPNPEMDQKCQDLIKKFGIVFESPSHSNS